MKEVHGLMVPDEDTTSWFRKNARVADRPTYQFETLQHAVKLCGQHGVAVDGGAHVGLWAIHLTRIFDLTVAFEPMPDVFQCLNVNMERYKDNPVTLHNVALGDVEEPAHMVRTRKSVSSHVVRTALENSQLVPRRKLDTFRLHTVDLLKLDVEGQEFEALMGALETLTRCKPVVVIEEQHDPARRATRLLGDLGMKQVWSCKHDYIFTWK